MRVPLMLLPVAVALLLPGAAAAKYINLSCADAKGALLVRVDTDAKTIQLAAKTAQIWNVLTGVNITDTTFSGSVGVTGGGTRLFEFDRASGVLQITGANIEQPLQSNCTVTTFPNRF